jgi:preprotein translocase subunit SecE
VARNRKRAKDRQPRGPERSSTARAGTDLREPFDRLEPAPDFPAPDRLDPALEPAPDLAAPDPLEHASPDAELAEAQLALGRLIPDPEGANGAAAPQDGEEEDEPELGEPELEGSDASPPAARRRPPRRGGDGGGRNDGGDRGGELAVPGGAPPTRIVPSEPLPLRLIAFLQGSWRELQRVQWPDRRQVMQATGVVIGFVIVAGILLGVSDLLSKRIVDFILYGHFS